MTARWAVATRVAEPHRLVVDVDGHPVQVGCDDAPLTDAAEAWATAFALPAARAGAVLALDRPLDATWCAGAAANVAATAAWWGGSSDLPVEAPPAGAPPHPTAAAAGRALCFTGGVDSFYALLCGDHHPTHLLYVVGFDVALDDRRRAEAVASSVRSVAAALGLAAVVVRTDLREHPRFDEISWEHTHGAALAAVGVLLQAEVGTLVIPPSYRHDRLIPWGSRPDLDPRWSVPGRTEVVHGDASGRRLDRLAAIVDHPLVADHLRVCWRNEGDDLNCGRCEKCVRTMASLAGLGALDRCTTFPPRAALVGAIDGLDVVPDGVTVLWLDLLDDPMVAFDDAERRAIRDLVERSGA